MFSEASRKNLPPFEILSKSTELDECKESLPMTEEDTQRHEIVTPAPVDIRSMRDDKVCHEKMKEINLFSCYDFELGDKHKVSGMDT